MCDFVTGGLEFYILGSWRREHNSAKIIASTRFDSEGNDQCEIYDFAGLFGKCVKAAMSVVAVFTCELKQTRYWVCLKMFSWIAIALYMYTIKSYQN